MAWWASSSPRARRSVTSSIWQTKYSGQPFDVAHDRPGVRHPDGAPVGVEKALVEAVRRTVARHRALHRVADLGPVLGMGEREQRHAGELVFGAPDHVGERSVHAEAAPVGRDERHADRRVVERGAESLLGFSQLGVCLLARRSRRDT